MSTLLWARSPDELCSGLASARSSGRRIALVPTMGALHAGHLALVRRARQAADLVVASLFVNPAQFGPAEDFAAYPRDEARDAGLLAAAGCDLLYAPTVDDMYPRGFSTTVSVAGFADAMEGAARPGHFAGVATVVTKLFNQCRPQIAVFGEKDYQQLQLIRRMTADLDLAVEIVAAPTVREPDGLAMSSRNTYLTASQRRIAPRLFATLSRAAQSLGRGASVQTVEANAVSALEAAGFDSVDYVEVRAAEDLARLGPTSADGPARILAVARLGRTRLLDNVSVPTGSGLTASDAEWD